MHNGHSCAWYRICSHFIRFDSVVNNYCRSVSTLVVVIVVQVADLSTTWVTIAAPDVTSGGKRTLMSHWIVILALEEGAFGNR